MKLPAYLGKLINPVLQGTAPLPTSVYAHFDGLCEPKNPGGIASLGWSISSEDDTEPLRQFHAVLADGGDMATNNWAEWVAFGTLLRYLVDEHPDVEDITIWGDSLLVVNQFNGVWATKAPHLIPLRSRALEIANTFIRRRNPDRELTVVHTFRKRNTVADGLATTAFRNYAAKHRPHAIAAFEDNVRRRRKD